MARLREALKQSAAFVELVQEKSWEYPEQLPDVLAPLHQELANALVEDPTAIIGKEALQSTYDTELSRLRGLLNDATGTLEAIRYREAEATGYSFLEIGV